MLWVVISAPEKLLVVTAEYLRLLLVELSCSSCKILWSFSYLWLNSNSHPARGRARGICCVELWHRCCDNALWSWLLGHIWGTSGAELLVSAPGVAVISELLDGQTSVSLVQDSCARLQHRQVSRAALHQSFVKSSFMVLRAPG